MKRKLAGTLLLGTILFLIVGVEPGNQQEVKLEQPATKVGSTDSMFRPPADPTRLPPVASPAASPVAPQSPVVQVQAKPASRATTQRQPTQRTTTKPPATTAPKPTYKTYYMSPVTAFKSQAMVDTGVLVTWTTSPTCLIAGHDSMGWSWLDNMPNGSKVVVKTGPCAGTYRVVAHYWQETKGGPYPSWMGKYAAVFQTCTGSTGTGFSAAVRW